MDTDESKLKHIFSPYNIVHIIFDLILVVVWIFYFIFQNKVYENGIPGIFAFIIIGSAVMNIGSCVVALLMKKGKARTGLIITFSSIGLLWILFAAISCIFNPSSDNNTSLTFVLLIVGILHIVYASLESFIPKWLQDMKADRRKIDDEDDDEVKTTPIVNHTLVVDEETINTEDKIMEYCLLEVRPKDFEKKVNALAAQGWKVISQSESTWTIRKCCGFSTTVDSIINVTLGR